MLDRIRKTMINHITKNSVTIIEYQRPLIDNGYGFKIPDLTKELTEVELGIARISRRRLPEPIVTNAGTVYDYQDVYYLLAAYDADWLRQNIVFKYHNEYFRTLLPEERIINGDIAYKLCNLEQVTARDVANYYSDSGVPEPEPEPEEED